MISTVLRTLAVGRREWIPSCLASLQISLETDENDGTSTGYFVTGLVSSMTQLRSGCKNGVLDVVKTVAHKRGFESWRKLSKEYGATTGTSLHEYTNLLEYDFGTTVGFKKRLLK